MNLNIIGYVIYLSITVVIIIKVGKICYENGSVYVAQLIPNHEDLCLKINHILLVAYYLFNLGYCAITLIQWTTITNYALLVEVICTKTAIILFLLASLHYFNILIITKQIKKLI
ncbi:hypothetical protein A5893_08020 [Pedobacter psychrophilus]|uniref:Uncharacterized protein n=1 Tax=Pedobacter psychrophilus TaxID=1826909 RepID=A0A179DF53_9SPHI|nr:hypothetical protein [Pedobacter psychrophilus]OAQ39534.1 hypothetical protein A5893_08020 [Pedobacter psychrophilus]